MTEPFLPKWIAWETTRRCNLQCVHCRSTSHQGAAEGGFSTDEGVQLLRQIAAYNPCVLVLSGGEPLLRPDIFTLAKEGTAIGLRMCLATNGTLVDDANCHEIKNSGIRVVSLSLDGASAVVHDAFRGQKGAFDGAVQAAQLFRAHGIEFIVNSSFTRRNQHDIAPTFHLAKSLGATAWYLFMVVPTGRGENIIEELVSAEDYEEILRWHYEQEKREGAMLMRPTCAPQYYRVVPEENLRSGSQLVRRSLKFSTGGGKGCIAGQSICLIANDGEVYPCSYFPYSAGNVKHTPFKEIWEGSSLFHDLRDYSRYRGKCGACEYLRVCGGCRARAWAISGDYLAEEPYCTHQPRRAQETDIERSST